MKKHLLIALLGMITLIAQAQVDAKYLKGAVPEVDGRVVFTHTIVPNKKISDTNLFDILNKWAENNYQKAEDSRRMVLLADKENMNIACQGDQKLVFTRKFLSLDQTSMLYQLILEINAGQFDATVRNIKYDYEDKRNIPAEELITDEVALKGEDKLYRNYDKFRIFTIDSIGAVFNSLEQYINGKVVVTKGAAESVSDERERPSASISKNTSMEGFRQVSADKIPSKYAKALDEKVVISWKSGNNVEVTTATWNGTDNFWDKLVAFDVIDPAKIKNKTIEKDGIYTISFFTDVYSDEIKNIESTGRIDSSITPIGVNSNSPAFAQAWMIIECRKLDTPASLAIAKEKGELHIGEILNVWVK